MFDLTSILQSVQKPSQYLGNEVNAVHKDFADCDIRVVLIFPDAYEMGMSHMGLKILYDILNNIEGVVAERCFAPGLDMEKILREKKIPLFSLESKTPLAEFDIIGISLPYELTYTNALNIIDLGGIPLWQKDRSEKHPFVIAGGTCSYNPEPMADFLDAVAIGDGEELILDVVSQIRTWKKQHRIDRITENPVPHSRSDFLKQLTQIEGMYIPQFFEPKYNDDGTIQTIKPLLPGYESVKKRVVDNLDAQPYPTKIVVPNIKLIHDRIGIEIQRGCTRMCRFCQAGYIERPTRQRSPEKVLQIAEDSLRNTGIDEISLLSLSAGDYATLVPMLKELNARYSGENVSISVPATRTETLTPEIIEQVKKVRMTGFTIAPEAGSERMRRVINKGNKVDDLLTACDNAFSAGYRLIKFYYMCGLPFETDDDVVGIANESYQALQVGWKYGRNIDLNVSVSSFVPKPFTPFQWEPQMTIAETRRKHSLVRKNLKHRSLNFKHHDAEMSFLEGLFARGDRRLSRVIHQAFVNGCRFDEWGEHFDFAKWQKTFSETGVDLDFYLHRKREFTEVFPWDHLFTQMRKDWLWQEYQAAAKEAFVADCSVEKCADFCGVCDFKVVKNKIYVVDEKPLAVKKGNREWYGRFGGGVGVPLIEPESAGAINHAPTPQMKLRVKFIKMGWAALQGHLELMEILKRAILRSKVPVAYSGGFHPQMKLAMGYALPLGIESECEFFDLTILAPVMIPEFLRDLNQALPGGLETVAAEYIDLNTPSIYAQTKWINYQVQWPQGDFYKTLLDLQQGKDLVFLRQKRGDKRKEKSFSIKEHLRLSTQLSEKSDFFEFSLRCDPDGSLKPSELVSALSKVPVAELTGLRIKKVGVDLAP